MRHHRLFAAGLAAALMLAGAASPALAKPGNGKGHGRDDAPGHIMPKPNKPPKPAKNKGRGVSGGGSIGTAEFSIQARTGRLDKGHFNYTVADNPATPTNEAYEIRCRGFDTATSLITVPTATLVSSHCTVTGAATPVAVSISVADNGQPKDDATPPTADSVTFSVAGGASQGGPLTGGNVKVR